MEKLLWVMLVNNLGGLALTVMGLWIGSVK
jgi:hypothetical protein